MQNYEQRIKELKDKGIIDDEQHQSLLDNTCDKTDDDLTYKNPYAKIILSIMAVAVLVVVVLFFGYTYNNIIKKEEQVKVAWSQVESNLQRKFDLLPNLVTVVKSYAKHEKELFTEITSLRSDAEKFLKSSKDKPDVKTLKQIQNRLNSSVMQLFAVAENYPELKLSEHFLELQAQIEGSENRINIV